MLYRKNVLCSASKSHMQFHTFISSKVERRKQPTKNEYQRIAIYKVFHNWATHDGFFARLSTVCLNVSVFTYLGFNFILLHYLSRPKAIPQILCFTVVVVVNSFGLHRLSPKLDMAARNHVGKSTNCSMFFST